MVTAGEFDVKKAYFKHLVNIVCDKNHKKADYIPLLDLLHSIPFVWYIDMDANRAGDGTYLRKEWLQKEDKWDYLSEFDDEKASVLEVLIGISKRIEFEIGDFHYGDCTSVRFWELLKNLDIEKYDSVAYNPIKIKEKLRKWMNLKYRKDGFGGLFPVKNYDGDMTKHEIWVQMNIYLEEKYPIKL